MSLKDKRWVPIEECTQLTSLLTLVLHYIFVSEFDTRLDDESNHSCPCVVDTCRCKRILVQCQRRFGIGRLSDTHRELFYRTTWSRHLCTDDVAEVFVAGNPLCDLG